LINGKFIYLIINNIYICFIWRQRKQKEEIIAQRGKRKQSEGKQSEGKQSEGKVELSGKI
jgi:hypothetical protein